MHGIKGHMPYAGAFASWPLLSWSEELLLLSSWCCCIMMCCLTGLPCVWLGVLGDCMVAAGPPRQQKPTLTVDDECTGKLTAETDGGLDFILERRW